MPLFTATQPFFSKEIPEDLRIKNPTETEFAEMQLLFSNIQEGLLANVQQALTKKSAWEVTDSDNYTLLTKAAFCGQVEIMNALLDFGFNAAFAPKAKPGINHSYNAFHAACAGGKGGIAAILLSKYRDSKLITVDMVDPLYEQTGLHIAIMHLNFKTAKALLNLPEQWGLNPGYVDKRLRTPLATTLGCFIRTGYETLVPGSNKMQLFEELFLQLLKRENAFAPPKPARPAIQIIFNDEFAYNYPSHHFPGIRTLPKTTLIRIMQNSPIISEALHKQALENQSLDSAKEFLQLYGECELSPEISKNNRTNLRSAFQQLSR